jgi:hypothetical protein
MGLTLPAHRKKQYLESGIVLRQVWPTCVWYKTFFFFITSSRMFEGRGEEKNSTHAQMMLENHTHTWDAHIYTLPSTNLSSLIVKSLRKRGIPLYCPIYMIILLTT